MSRVRGRGQRVGQGWVGEGRAGRDLWVILPEFPLPEEGAFDFRSSRPPQPIEPMHCRAAARQLRRLLTPSPPRAGEAGAAGVTETGETGGVWRGWKMCVVRAVHALQKQPAGNRG